MDLIRTFCTFWGFWGLWDVSEAVCVCVLRCVDGELGFFVGGWLLVGREMGSRGFDEVNELNEIKWKRNEK